MKERWDLNRRAVRLLCHLDRKYFLCTLFSSLTTAIAPYIPIYFSAKIIDALTAGAGGKTLALYAALTVGLTALIGLAGALLKMHADVGEAELDRLVDWQHAEKAMDLPYALIEDRKTALLRERIEMETQTGYNVYYYAVTADCAASSLPDAWTTTSAAKSCMITPAMIPPVRIFVCTVCGPHCCRRSGTLTKTSAGGREP